MGGQGDLVVGKMYEQLGKGVGPSPWLTLVTAVQGHLRRQANLVSKMGTICPPVQLTRWLAMSKLLEWLTAKQVPVMAHYTALAVTNGAPHATQPGPTVWLYTYAMQAIVDVVAATVTRLQGKAVTIADAQQSVIDLAESVANLVGVVVADHVFDYDDEGDAGDTVVAVPGGRFKLRTTDVEAWLRDMGAIVCGLVNDISEEETQPVLRSIGHTVLLLVHGLYDIATLRDEANGAIMEEADPCLPQELCMMGGQKFAD